MSRSRIWLTCRTIFQRARLLDDTGLRLLGHAHPHTFRHTTVKMLWMMGNSWENIAKWLGHASPTITSTIYGQLTAIEIDSRIHADFIDNGTGVADAREEWRELAAFVAQPYTFEKAELPGSPRDKKKVPKHYEEARRLRRQVEEGPSAH